MPQAPITTASTPRATERGLQLVSIVADHPHGVTLADAARAVDLSPSTTLRQLRSLASMGFAVHRQDGQWVPGPELLRIARSLSATASLARLAAPVLEQLTAATGESSYLAEATDGQHAVYVATEDGRHAVRHVSWLGQTVTRRGTAVGAALAGRVDADGVTVRNGAVEDGVTALSAPVRDVTGRVIGAVSAVGPSFRLTGPALAAARAAVAAAATTLGTAAG